MQTCHIFTQTLHLRRPLPRPKSEFDPVGRRGAQRRFTLSSSRPQSLQRLIFLYWLEPKRVMLMCSQTTVSEEGAGSEGREAIVAGTGPEQAGGLESDTIDHTDDLSSSSSWLSTGFNLVCFWMCWAIDSFSLWEKQARMALMSAKRNGEALHRAHKRATNKAPMAQSVMPVITAKETKC